MAETNLNAADTAPAVGFVALSTAALERPVRAVLVVVAGNLAVELADGSDNNSNAFAVTVGQVFPFAVVKTKSNNTATLLGLR